MIAKLALIFLVGMAILALFSARPRAGDGRRGRLRRPRLFRRKPRDED